MRTLNILCVTFAVALLNSCNLHKNITYKEEPKISTESVHYNHQNYREYKEQELIYYKYTLERKSDTRKGEEKKPKKSEETSETPSVKYKEELIQTLEGKGLKPCRFVEKVLKKSACGDTLNKTTEIIKDPVEESKPKKGLLKNKSKEYRQSFWEGFFRIVSIVYFTILSLTNFHLFTILLPTSICLLACICYPIWWKRGYLDNPYAKIATFIAAYGGLLANILWIILYL